MKQPQPSEKCVFNFIILYLFFKDLLVETIYSETFFYHVLVHVCVCV